MEHSPFRLVLTCEHASAAVPARWRPLFRSSARELASHRGFDRGALPIARRFARALRADLTCGRATRLLIDLNRSLTNRAVFSLRTRVLPALERQAIVEALWLPYRREVERRLRAAAASACRVLHLSIHSFTPVYKGCVREMDVGLLYDPSRSGERDLARRWKKELLARRPGMRVRFNQPYRGTSDGLTTALRRLHGDGSYVGLELELNQALLGPRPSPALSRALVESFAAAGGLRCGRGTS